MKKNRFHALLLGTLLIASTSAAQAGLPLRDPKYFEDASELAGVLGSAHAVRYRCGGDDAQYWRRYMADLLKYEAPSRGALRDTLVRSFNDAYTRASAEYARCDQRAVEAEGRYARQGQALSNRLSTHYFPKRDRKSRSE